MRAPIVVIVFNRPHHARKLRVCLNGEQHRDLYVIVDGARKSKIGEAELVSACVSEFEDWGGLVKFNIAEENLGCKARISSGLDWVFKHTDRAIILEDDLSPSPQFFHYCDEMLETYADSPDVMSVCGTKTYPADVPGAQYFFSKYNNCWGWATWKRAWEQYEDRFEDTSGLQMFLRIGSFLGSYKAAFYWHIMLMLVFSGRRNSWAYCWMISCFLNKGLHVYPAANLIVNSGFGDDSTHTLVIEPYMPQKYGKTLVFPIQSSGVPVVADNRVDRWIDDNIYSKSISVRLKWLSEKRIGGIASLMKKHT